MRIKRSAAAASLTAAEPACRAVLHPKARRALCCHLPAVVVAGRELEILVVAAAIGMLELDSHIRELHPIADDWQPMRIGPGADLLGASRWPPRGVVSLALFRVQKALVVALQLVVEQHTLDARALALQPLGGTHIHARELRIMGSLLRLRQSPVIRLRSFVLRSVTMPLQQRLARPRQGHQSGPFAIENLGRDGNQSLRPQVLQIAMPAVARSVLDGITRINHAKRADGRQRANLRATERVVAGADLDALSV